MTLKTKTKLDSLARDKKAISWDLPTSRYVIKYKKSSTYYSKNGLTKSFFTADSKLYFTQDQLEKVRQGEKIFQISGLVDSLASRNYRTPEKEYIYLKLAQKKARRSIRYSLGSQDYIYDNIQERYASLKSYLQDLLSGSVQGLTMARMWNLSIVGSIIFGMFLMTMIYRYLGQGVMAGGKDPNLSSKPAAELVYENENKSTMVLGESDSKDNSDDPYAHVSKLIEEQSAKRNSGEAKSAPSSLEKQIREMTKGYPIEKMAPLIAKQDKTVAAFIVAIAKKESDWGEHVPVNNGADCYNYWGFRAKRAKMGTGGHTCFDSPKDAIDSVSKRITELVEEEKYDTPGKMVSPWKCGYDCSWDKKSNVDKWVSDVDRYFKPLKNAKN